MKSIKIKQCYVLDSNVWRSRWSGDLHGALADALHCPGSTPEMSIGKTCVAERSRRRAGGIEACFSSDYQVCVALDVGDLVLAKRWLHKCCTQSRLVSEILHAVPEEVVCFRGPEFCLRLCRAGLLRSFQFFSWKSSGGAVASGCMRYLQPFGGGGVLLGIAVLWRSSIRISARVVILITL